MTGAFRPETLVAVDAVRQALALARRRVGAEAITSKGGRDVVTATDVAVEDAVRDLMSGALGFPVVGEEGGGEASARSFVSLRSGGTRPWRRRDR